MCRCWTRSLGGLLAGLCCRVVHVVCRYAQQRRLASHIGVGYVRGRGPDALGQQLQRFPVTPGLEGARLGVGQYLLGLVRLSLKPVAASCRAGERGWVEQ